MDRMNLKTVKKILDYLIEFPFATANEIANFIKSSPATVMKYLNGLYKMGVVTFRKVGKIKRWKIDDKFLTSDGFKAFNKMLRVKR